VLLSGGQGEAAAMHALARAAGVPATALRCESRSRNTAENALYSARMLRAAGIGEVILVSHRTHLLRARLLFRLAGIAVVGSAGVAARSRPAAALAAAYEAASLPRSFARILRRR
jgi:uncharacterized SAM-binding protein YcdF (DUF218 family)